MENDFADVKAQKHKEESRGHGRVDKLVYYQMSWPNQLPGRDRWPGVRTIGVAVRMSEGNGRHTSDTRYYISSLRLGVKQFASVVRGHWGIENALRWSLDVTFREDDSRVRNRYAAENLAWLKRMVISLIKQQKSKESIVMRRRMAGWNVNFLAEIIGLPTG